MYMSGVEQLARCTCAGIQVEVHRFLCMYVCMYVCMQVCVHVCICMHVCNYVAIKYGMYKAVY